MSNNYKKERNEHSSSFNEDFIQGNQTQPDTKKLREAIDKDVEQFLTAGGQIQVISPDVLGDPPKKPTFNYGKRPI